MAEGVLVLPAPRRELSRDELRLDPYALLNSVLVPRPVLWVSTRSADGVDNLAPFSWVTVVSTRPPVVAVTAAAGTDTLAHCRGSGEFVLSLPPEGLLDAVVQTGVAHHRGVSEFDVAGLTREPAALVAVARVAESPLSLECRVVGERTFGHGDEASTVVFGEVVHAAVATDVLRDGLPDVTRLRPLARLNRDLWGTLGPLREVPSPTTLTPQGPPGDAAPPGVAGG